MFDIDTRRVSGEKIFDGDEREKKKKNGVNQTPVARAKASERSALIDTYTRFPALLLPLETMGADEIEFL